MTGMSRCASVALAVLWSAACATARAQIAQFQFETPPYVGGASGVLLTGQDGWTLPQLPAPGSVDRNVYTYAAHSLGVPSNPQGGLQCDTGVTSSSGVPSRAQHTVDFSAGDMWRMTFDCLGKYVGTLPTSDNLGSLSLQDSATSRFFQTLMSWGSNFSPPTINYTATAARYHLAYSFFTDADPTTTRFATVNGAWRDLFVDHWYRNTVEWTFGYPPRLLSISIQDLTTGGPVTTADLSNNGWYLAGGSISNRPLPTAIRTFSGGAAGNLSAFDNISISHIIPSTGACCYYGGYCTVVTALECAQYNGGVYHGDNTSCSPLPCSVFCPPSWSYGSFPASGANPGKIATGDFNADGKLDFAVTNGTSNTVTIEKGNGNGTFQPLTSYVVGSSPACVAVGNFNPTINNNTFPDIVTGSYGGDGISILFGHGDGTFDPPAAFGAGTVRPRAIGVGDFNSDGFLDLAVASDSHPGSTVSIFVGNGDGSFQVPPLEYGDGAGDDSHVGVVVKDLNGDGKLDLAVVNASGTLSVLLGNGIGPVLFQPAVNYATGPHPIAIASGDFNQDGHPDIAVASADATIDPNGNTANILLNTGNISGTLLPAALYPSGYKGVADMAVGDFNADGIPDIALTNGTSGYVSVLRGAGDGTFENRIGFYLSPATASPGGIAAGLFSDDLLLDLVVANYGNNTISVLTAQTPSPGGVIQPSSVTTCVAGQVFFSVGIGGSLSPSFQWEVESGPLGSNTWSPLTDGSVVHNGGIVGSGSGANSNNYFFTSSPFNLEPIRFRCVIFTPCYTVTTDPATVTICYANCDCSETPPVLTANDFQCFLNSFAAGAAVANCDGSTVPPVLTANDFQCFLNAFAAGCP